MSDSTQAKRPEAATVRQRTLAYVVDAVVLGVPAAVSVGRLDRSLGSRIGVLGVLGTIVGLAYHVVLEGAVGRTVGKRLLGIAVVRESGDPCTYGAATVRTAFRFVDFLPIAYLGGIASIVVTERNQRVGDVAANTVVVEDESA